MPETVPVPTEILLHTGTTSMAFQRTGATWLLVHYGARLVDSAGVDVLARDACHDPSKLGRRVPATYPVFGSGYEGTRTTEKFGGLAVIHADGVASTELQAAGVEQVEDVPGTTHLAFGFRDRTYPFFVTQHFRAVAASDVIETWIELRHDEPAPVRLVRMDSVALVLPNLASEIFLLSLTGEWGAEGQLSEAPLSLGHTVSLQSRSGVRSALGCNPSFMLSLGPRATETSGRVIGGTLAWSGAWEISVQRDQANTLALNAGTDNASGPYTLDPGRPLVLPTFALTYSTEGKGQVSRNFHRWARDVQLCHGHALRPVLLNSWEGAYFSFTEQTLTDMMDGVEQLGGEMFVLDDGWFGRGSHARDDDRRGLGDWVVNDAKLPRGLAWLASEAHSRGLKFGLWAEPEMANTASDLVERHPDWVLREGTRPLRLGRGGTQVVLDLTNPAVGDNLFQQLDALIGAIPGLAYVKWDANADVMNVGSPHLAADRQPNLWFDYTAGLYRLLDRLRRRYPALNIQACASGGGRMDFGFLRYADECWTSDNTDARQRVFIQWGASHFYPAGVIAAHVTAVPNHQTHRSTPLKFRFDVAMSARLGFELNPKDMSADEIAFARRAVADYKRIRPLVQQGNLFRLVSPWESDHAALMYVSDDQQHAVIFVYGLNRLVCSDPPAPLPLAGLGANLEYRVTEISRESPDAPADHAPANGHVVSGATLLAMGLRIGLAAEYDSAVFELVAV